MIDKAESRRIQDQIRRVLLDVWDPIGVKDEPLAQGEYDSYIGKLYDLLVDGAPDNALVEYLTMVAHERMGFTLQASVFGASRTVPSLRELRLAGT